MAIKEPTAKSAMTSAFRWSALNLLWIFALLISICTMLVRGKAYIDTIQGSHPICGATPRYKTVTFAAEDRRVGLVLDMRNPNLEKLLCAQDAFAPRVVVAVDRTPSGIWSMLQEAPVLVESAEETGIDGPLDAWVAEHAPLGHRISRQEFPDALIVLRLGASK